MKIFFLLFVLVGSAQAAVKFDVRWTETFRKELVITCQTRDNTCLSVCQKTSECVIKEGACRDCIGTSVRFSRMIDELGNLIQNDGSYAPLNRVLDLVTSGNFVSLVPNDPYNVIDGINSVRGIKKFEDLCPVGSQKQILLASVDVDSRKIDKPEVVICDFYGRSYFYGITSDPEVLIEDESLTSYPMGLKEKLLD